MKSIKRIKSAITGQKGAVMVVTMALMALMVMSTVFLGVMLQQDVALITKVKSKSQARYMAEAGIYHALAKIKLSGFSSRADFDNTMTTGSYKVAFSESGGRHLIASVGTVGGVSETALVEVEDLTPSALYYVASAGNDVMINSFVANADIIGDVHSNSDTRLRSDFLISWLRITGDVSACNDVVLGNRHNQSDLFDWHVVINGVAGEGATVEEGAQTVFFPRFDYDAYIEAAMETGDYTTADLTFSDETLTPGNGIICTTGNATFEGNCTLNGGIIARNIYINGTLRQVKTGYRNVIIAWKRDIRIFGRLDTEEALIFAARDILGAQAFAELDINGIMMAGRDINLWNFLVNIDYNHVETYPVDMGTEEEGQSFRVMSWNM
jgi:hypothetical protein